MATTKKTATKTKEVPGKTPGIAQGGPQEPAKVSPVYHTDPELIRRLDRIVELLEGTLSVDRKGLKLDSPFWNKMLDPDR
jgi:hypothetical protein